MNRLALLLGILALALAAPVMADESAPVKPGTVALTVSLPNPGQKLLFVDEVMPVTPGPLTLLYPKWIPGDHSPDGPIDAMMGLQVSAGGKRIAWRRDDDDMFAFHLTVPAGVDRIDIRFQFPARDRATVNLLDLTWDHVALYRAGYPTKDQMFEPALVIPADWQHASALKTQKRDGGRITFAPVPFNTLVDSPVIAGKFFREIDLTPAGSSVHRYLDMVGDTADSLKISAAQTAGFRHLIEQAQALFASHHYEDYHLLLTMSDHTSVGGLEHHQSSDDRARSGAKLFADADHFMLDGSLLPHEYTHSWNGKFMRPAGLWQPDFEHPQRGELLWVYEGLTVYLGDMLTVRSGLWSPQTWRDVVAYRAAAMTHRTGRAWRPLIDTTRAAQIVYGSSEAWSNWRRQTDFYREGQLLWFAVDMKIRELSGDKRSVDDFARRFFSVDDGSFVTRTYTDDDVIKGLDAVQAYDWKAFFDQWLEGVGDEVPLLSGIDASGWRLVYTDKLNSYQNALENVGMGELEGKGVNEMFSLGLFLDKAGKIEDVLWEGPAFKAGLAPGMKLVSVNGRTYSTVVLREEIVKAQHSRKPLQVSAQGDGVTATHAVSYFDGLRYPHLVRVQDKRDYQERILAPMAPEHRP
ncbi:MAG: M61 family metallopeptidase [Proteobacteria bacterium]|nr:M61 family metallopeptidase [Pseudomonadota bacterium]